VTARGNFSGVTDQPEYREGDVLRRARLRPSRVPKLTIKAAAALAGFSAEQWGVIERGHTRSRDGQGPRPFRGPAWRVASMAAVLDLTGGEFAELAAAYPEAAEALKGSLSGPSEAERLIEGDDRLIEALMHARPDADVLEQMWRRRDGEGRLRPRGERVTMILSWIGDDEASPVSETG